jgi:ribonuclease HIII
MEQELEEVVLKIEQIAMDKLKDKWEHLYTFGYPKRPFPSQYERDLNNVKIGLYEGNKVQTEKVFTEADMILFAEWIRIKDFQTTDRNNWIGLDLKYYTSKDLFNQFKDR